jgi:hypothetical protein
MAALWNNSSIAAFVVPTERCDVSRETPAIGAVKNGHLVDRLRRFRAIEVFVNLKFQITPGATLKRLPLHLALQPHDNLRHLFSVGHADVHLGYLDVSINLGGFRHPTETPGPATKLVTSANRKPPKRRLNSSRGIIAAFGGGCCENLPRIAFRPELAMNGLKVRRVIDTRARLVT